MEDEVHSLGLPHIRCGEEGGRVIVQIDDDELFDFVDDYLTEHSDLECETVRFSDSVETTNTMLFRVGTLRHKVEAALRKLDPLEVERIYRINNPAELEK